MVTCTGTTICLFPAFIYRQNMLNTFDEYMIWRNFQTSIGGYKYWTPDRVRPSIHIPLVILYILLTTTTQWYFDKKTHFNKSTVYIGQYQIVVHFGYGSTMKYFANTCVFSLIQFKEKCLSFPNWHICNPNISILSCGSIFITRIYG